MVSSEVGSNRKILISWGARILDIFLFGFYFLAPLKGIPSRVPTSGFRSGILNNNMNNRPPLSRATAGRKEGGVKLLDIADQPLGYAAAKKRKKMQGEVYILFMLVT